MFKVAVLQISKSRSHSQYLEGVNALKGMAARSGEPGSVEIRVFVAGGIEHYNIARQLESIRQYKPDALLSVGATCSLAAKTFFQKLECALPIVFMGVLNPSKIGLMSNMDQPDEEITGVSVEPPPDELPIQALLKLRPHIKRFIFVYRKEAHRDRIAFEVNGMERYVCGTGRTVLHVPFKKGDDLTRVLDERIRENDGIIIPKLSITPLDQEKIDLACKKKKAFLFAHADGIMPESAICGYSGDIQFMGHKAAQYLFEILYNKKPVSELPVKIYPSPSRLVVSKTAMIRHGIVMGTDDFHIILDGTQHKMTLRHNYSFVAPHMSVLEMRLHKELTEAGLRTDDGSEYKPILQEGRCADEGFTTDQMIYTLEDEYPFIVTIGTRSASRLQHAMVKRGIFKPIILIAYDDDSDADFLSDSCPQWPSYAFLRTVIIPTVEPKVFPSISKLLQPHAKRLGCVYSFCDNNLPKHVATRLGVVQEHCESRGLTFVHDGDSRSNKDFDLVCKDIVRKTDAMFTLPDCIRNSDLEYAASNCHASNTFILGGDNDNFHLVSGILTLDYSKLTPLIMSLITEVSWDRVPAQKEIRLATEDIYYFYLNEPWLRTHGVILPDDIDVLFGINVLRDPYNDDHFNPPGKSQDETNKRMERPRFIDEEEYKKRFNKKVVS